MWKSIDEAFSRPISVNDNVADYVPTQIITEVFRKEGLDGVAYRSALGPGHNIAIFNLNAADIASRHLCTVTSLKIVVEEEMTRAIR